MTWFINDISLTGQYSTSSDFIRDLSALFKVRNSHKIIKDKLFFSRTLPMRPVVNSQSLREIVSSSDSSNKKLFLICLDKSGPFWDTDSCSNEECCFDYCDQDVTEQGMGEAARQIIDGKQASTYSFRGADPCCNSTPLVVTKYNEDDTTNPVDIPNISDIATLESIAASIPEPISSWNNMLELARNRFDNLLISEEIDTVIQAHPFTTCVAERVLDLLQILQDFIDSRDANHEYTAKTNELISNFFSNDGRFSDESTSNKQDFKNQMTFKDPEDDSKDIFCPWHGKIKTRKFRIHFDFPVDANTEKIKVCYIGPKITKD